MLIIVTNRELIYLIIRLIKLRLPDIRIIHIQHHMAHRIQGKSKPHTKPKKNLLPVWFLNFVREQNEEIDVLINIFKILLY